MGNESDGTGKADNLEVIRKLLQKLEEAAAGDGGRPGDPERAAQASRRAAPRPQPPVLEAQPIVPTDSGSSRELSSLQRSLPPALIEQPPVPAVRANGGPVAAAPDPSPPVRRGARSPMIAVASFALGAVTAAAVVSYFEPIKWLLPQLSKPHAAPAIEVAATPAGAAPAKPASPAAETPQSTAPEPLSQQAGVQAAPHVDDTVKTAASAPSEPPVPQRSPDTGPDTGSKTKDVATAAPQAPSPPAAAALPSAPPIAAAAAEIPASPPAPGLIALSVARRIEGRSGTRLAFPLRLEPMPQEDQHLLVVVRGVPEWATMSKGSAIDSEIWLLPAHAAADLEIDYSAAAQGMAELRVELATHDGRLLARAPTLLVANRSASQAIPPITAQPTARLDGEAVVRLLARGDLLLDTGDFGAARELYKAAAEAGSAGAALKLGQTYDPAEVDRLGMTRKVADEALARRWYELAQSLGSTLAGDRLSALGR